MFRNPIVASLGDFHSYPVKAGSFDEQEKKKSIKKCEEAPEKCRCTLVMANSAWLSEVE